MPIMEKDRLNAWMRGTFGDEPEVPFVFTLLAVPAIYFAVLWILLLLRI